MSGIVLKRRAAADIPTPDTDKATIFLDDATGEPSYKDDAAVVASLRGTAGADGADGADGELSYTDHGSTGSTETVDVSTNIHRLVANAATVTLTLSGAPASGTPCISRLYLFQDGTGGRDWAFPGSVTFGDAGEPDWTTRGLNALDVVDLTTIDGGTTYYAVVVGRAGATGAAGSNGTNGTTGGAVTIPYTFSTTTTDSDPGSGNLRLDNATQTSATKIRADLNGSDGTTWTTVIDSLDDSSSTVKGHIRLFKTSDPSKWLLFTVSAVDSSSGYRNITVANVAGSASSPFANSDAITLTFTRTGDVGASGTASVGSDPIWDAAGDLAVGTGADTAAKLTKGSDGSVLRMASGAVGWGYLPFHGAKAYKVGTQTVLAGAEDAITFTSEEYDTDTFHDNSSNTSRFTAPVTGKYRLTATLWFASGLTSANGTACAMSFYTNGATIGSSTVVRGGSNGAVVQYGTTGANQYNLTADVIIAAGDYAELKVFNGTFPTASVVVGHASAAAVESTMSIELLGV